MSPIRKRPAKNAPTPPERDVREKQDPQHTLDDFLRDLRKASSNRAKPPRPAGSSGRG
jgi:hypothetical protein